MPLLNIQSPLVIVPRLIFWAIFPTFILIFAMILSVRFFIIFKKKNGAIAEKYLHISSGTFFCLKHLTGKCKVTKNVCTGILRGSSCVLYTHMQIRAEYILTQWIKTSDTILRKIYLSLYLKGVVCERELETEQNCNILTPILMAISVVSFLFSSAAQPGA